MKNRCLWGNFWEMWGNALKVYGKMWGMWGGIVLFCGCCLVKFVG